MSEASDVDLEPPLEGMTLAQVLEHNWRLRIRCLVAGCGHVAEPTMTDLARRFRRGLGASMPDLVGRFRCAACGGRRLRVLNLNGGEFSYMAYEGFGGRAAAFNAWLAEVWAGAKPTAED
jgi:hypothetical protein